MLSALLELLPSIHSKEISSNLDFTALLVSAYPDLQPWYIQEASGSEHADDFYMEYVSSLLHYEDGNDAAKRDAELIKVGDLEPFEEYLLLSSPSHFLIVSNFHCDSSLQEWCLMLSSPNEADPAIAEMYRQSFFHIASRDDTSSHLYYRDLPFLMDVSVKMAEFGLTLSLGKSIHSTMITSLCKRGYLLMLTYLYLSKRNCLQCEILPKQVSSDRCP